MMNDLLSKLKTTAADTKPVVDSHDAVRSAAEAEPDGPSGGTAPQKL